MSRGVSASRDVNETALDPRRPICDPHHHLWDRSARGDGTVARYLFDDFLADAGSGHNIVSSVFIECGAMWKRHGPEALRPVGETEFANGVAAMAASGLYGAARVAAAIVATASLDRGAAVGEVLDAQRRAGGGRLRGIRQAIARDDHPAVPNHRTDPRPGLFAEPGFRAGFAELAPRGLSFDVWCYHPQLPQVLDLARAFPDTTIVLDHLGGLLGIGPYAGRDDERTRFWRAALAELAGCDNVVVKLGGLGMDTVGHDWHRRRRKPDSAELAQAFRPYVDYAVERFGVDRCMFESNFPVDQVSCDYATLWNAFKRLTSGCSDPEKNALFHDTAVRVYRIDDADE